MNKQFQAYSDKYLQLTPREQYLILLSGLAVIFLIVFYLFIDVQTIKNNNIEKQIIQLKSRNQTLQLSISDVQAALQGDPNKEISNTIAQYERKLEKIDANLLALTSDLISPVQMRYALLDLLKLEKGVSLLSFELIGAQPLLVNHLAKNNTSTKVATKNTTVNKTTAKPELALNLYRHGIKIKLSGSYFALRNYLSQLEQLPWKFFWQDFNFNVIKYPNSELEIQMYSLGTKKEFVGV